MIKMDIKRKKQLLEEYENRNPDMGVISFRCIKTDETFLGISKDMPADFNSNKFKLQMNSHPNKKMQELWNKYGEIGFEIMVVSTLKYEDPKANHSKELEALREKCFQSNPKAERIWR